jgi:hypothetical protein
LVITSPEIRVAPLGPQIQPVMARHDIICVHTMVGYLVSTDTFFRISNGAGYAGVESHFGIGGQWGPDLGGGWDGAIWEWQSLARTADANVDGNPRVISIETADNGVRPIAPWTDRQMDSLVHLIAWLCTPTAHADCPSSWLCHQVGIPPVLVPDTQPTRRGLAYHAQGAVEHTVGEWWSTDSKKDCPTAVRIDQFKQIVIPRVVARLDNKEEDDVSYDDVVRALQDVLRLPGSGLAVPRGQLNNGNTLAMLVGMAQQQVNRDNAQSAAIAALARMIGTDTANDLTAEQVRAIVDESIEAHMPAPEAPPTPAGTGG